MTTSAFGTRKNKPRYAAMAGPVVALVVVVLVVVWLVRAAINSFQPLHTGSLEMPVGTRVADGNRSDHRGVHRVAWRNGQVVTYGVAIRNSGPVGVRVLAIEAPEAPEGVVTLEAVRASDPDEPSFAPAAGAPFSPFTLDDDDERFVTLDVKLANCAVVTQPVRVDKLRVRWSALGIERESTVPLDTVIELAPQRGCARG